MKENLLRILMNRKRYDNVFVKYRTRFRFEGEEHAKDTLGHH